MAKSGTKLIHIIKLVFPKTCACVFVLSKVVNALHTKNPVCQKRHHQLKSKILQKSQGTINYHDLKPQLRVWPLSLQGENMCHSGRC